MKRDAILALNAGSSSLKCAVFREGGDATLEPLARGEVSILGARSRFTARDSSGTNVVDERLEVADHSQAFDVLERWLRARFDPSTWVAIAHRIVHGGDRFVEPVWMDGEVLSALDSLVPLAPLHQRSALDAVLAVARRQPDLPQLACFDTAFHHGRAPVTRMFALPQDLTDSGIRKYGFHGLSFESIRDALVESVPTVARGRVIVAHLGHGASLCAMNAGKSVDTTMSFTALDGLAMATRCGSLDPGVVLYLLRERGMTVAGVERLLYCEAGLLGVSGTSGDMRDLLARADPRARLAVDLFVHYVVRESGALIAVLGGVDALVFTAGIGENAPEIRARACAGLAWLGLELDPRANAAGGPRISTSASRVSAWVIRTDEEAVLARSASRALRTKPSLVLGAIKRTDRS